MRHMYIPNLTEITFQGIKCELLYQDFFLARINGLSALVRDFAGKTIACLKKMPLCDQKKYLRLISKSPEVPIGFSCEEITDDRLLNIFSYHYLQDSFFLKACVGCRDIIDTKIPELSCLLESARLLNNLIEPYANHICAAIDKMYPGFLKKVYPAKFADRLHVLQLQATQGKPSDVPYDQIHDSLFTILLGDSRPSRYVGSSVPELSKVELVEDACMMIPGSAIAEYVPQHECAFNARMTRVIDQDDGNDPGITNGFGIHRWTAVYSVFMGSRSL